MVEKEDLILTLSRWCDMTLGKAMHAFNYYLILGYAAAEGPRLGSRCPLMELWSIMIYLASIKLIPIFHIELEITCINKK